MGAITSAVLLKRGNIPNGSVPPYRSKSNKRCPTSLDLKAKMVRLGDGWQVSGRLTAFLDCFLSKWSESRSALPTDSPSSPPPSRTSRRNDELEKNTTDFKSGPLLMRGINIYKKIPVSVTKLKLGLQEGLISSHLTVVKLFPVNPRAVTGPQKMSLLLEAKSMPTLIIKRSLILVLHKNNIGWYITSNQQGQMFIQSLNRIVSKPNVTPGQITYCTTGRISIDLMFQGNFPANTQVWNRLSHRNDCRHRGVIWVAYRCYNSNPYLVRNISHQEVKCSTTCMGLADNQLITTGRKRLQLHDGSWSQNPTTTDDGYSDHTQTGKRHGHLQPARQPFMQVNNKKSVDLGQGRGKDWTHKGPVSHHKPKKSAFRNNDTQIWVGEMLHNHLVRMQPSLEPKATCPGTTRQGDRIREPATLTRDAYLRPKSQSTTVYHTETKPLSGRGSWLGPTHFYRVFCRQQEHDAAGQGWSQHPDRSLIQA